MRDARPWTYAALFGALWGALEMTLGTVLNLAGVPLAGLLMSLLGLVCLVTLRRLQPRPGVCVLAGAVAVFLKVFTLGGLSPGPILGIGGEALLVELAFALLGSRHVGAVLGGALALTAPPLQMVIVTWAVAGREALAAYAGVIRAVSSSLGVGQPSGEVILAGGLVAVAVAGAVGGHWAWSLAGRVLRRLGRRG